jgi:hypothetical protein
MGFVVSSFSGCHSIGDGNNGFPRIVPWLLCLFRTFPYVFFANDPAKNGQLKHCQNGKISLMKSWLDIENAATVLGKTGIKIYVGAGEMTVK